MALNILNVMSCSIRTIFLLMMKSGMMQKMTMPMTPMTDMTMIMTGCVIHGML